LIVIFDPAMTRPTTPGPLLRATPPHPTLSPMSSTAMWWNRTATTSQQCCGEATAHVASIPPCAPPPTLQVSSPPCFYLADVVLPQIPGESPTAPAVAPVSSMYPTPLPSILPLGAAAVIVRSCSCPPPVSLLQCVVCCWLGPWGCLFLFFSISFVQKLFTYDNLVQNGSSGFSIKKVDYPAPLF
jgi:hypothetical protein